MLDIVSYRFWCLLAAVVFVSAASTDRAGAQGPQPPAGAGPAAQQPYAPAPPMHAPFRLSPQEEEYLNRVLIAWQDHTDTVKTFKCTFVRWNYNPAFENAQFKDKPLVVNDGDLKYAAPDRGTFHVSRVRHLNVKTGQYEEPKGEYGEHWVCDGKSVWEHDHKKKQVIERPIPADLQGTAIRNGPLPFLFGSRAADLKRRYFMRIVTPQEFAEKEIWVDAFPRTRQEATNFQRAILRLDRSNFQPIALRIYDPGDTFASYEFSKILVNDRFEGLKNIFAPPQVPFGYRKIVELPPEATARRPAAPPSQR